MPLVGAVHGGWWRGVLTRAQPVTLARLDSIDACKKALPGLRESLKDNHIFKKFFAFMYVHLDHAAHTTAQPFGWL